MPPLGWRKVKESCSFEDCGRPRDSRGLCKSHYVQVRRGGPLRPLGSVDNDHGKVCEVDGCDERYHARGKCQTHYLEVYNAGRTRDLDYGRAMARETYWRGRAITDEFRMKGCVDCGLTPMEIATSRGVPVEKAVGVFDFDHLPGVEKVMPVMAMARSCSRQRLLAEIAKCEVVCSNCHRIRTILRKEEG